MPFERALVVGASSGIGAGIVAALAARGTRVAALARRKPELDQLAVEWGDRVLPICHDVRNIDDAPVIFDHVVDELGGLDLVIYSAGVMPSVEEGEYNTLKDDEIVQVNLMGAVAWLNLAAAYMEARRRGTIMGISSVAGDRGRRRNPVYTASKAGLNAYLEALRNRLTRYGVHVITIKPGPIDTPMNVGMEPPLMISTGRCVAMILKSAEAQRPATRYVPGFWRLIMSAIRVIPSVIFHRANI